MHNSHLYLSDCESIMSAAGTRKQTMHRHKRRPDSNNVSDDASAPVRQRRRLNRATESVQKSSVEMKSFDEKLRRYKRAIDTLKKFITSPAVRELADYTVINNWQRMLRGCTEELEAFRNRPAQSFTIGLLGEVKVGKSQLLNNILDCEPTLQLLPSLGDTKSTTAKRIIVGYNWMRNPSTDPKYIIEIYHDTLKAWVEKRVKFAKAWESLEYDLEPKFFEQLLGEADLKRLNQRAFPKGKVSLTASRWTDLPEETRNNLLSSEHRLRLEHTQLQALLKDGKTLNDRVALTLFHLDTIEQVNEKLSIYGKATHPAALAVHEILLKGPFPMLRDGVRVMDLPGVNDDNRVIDAVAWSSIPMASHVWILQPSEDTGAKAEDSFYYNQLLKRLLVTVNKLPERCTVVLTKTDKSVAISPNGQYDTSQAAALISLAQGRWWREELDLRVEDDETESNDPQGEKMKVVLTSTNHTAAICGIQELRNLIIEIGKPLQEEAEAVLQLIGDLYKAIKRSVAEPTSRSEPNVVHPTTRNSAVDLNAMVESIFKCQRDEYLHVLKTRLQVFTDKLRSSANETNEDYLSGSAMNYLSGINHRTLLALYRKRGHHQDNLGIWHNLNNALADAALGPVYVHEMKQLVDDMKVFAGTFKERITKAISEASRRAIEQAPCMDQWEPNLEPFQPLFIGEFVGNFDTARKNIVDYVALEIKSNSAGSIGINLYTPSNDELRKKYPQFKLVAECVKAYWTEQLKAKQREMFDMVLVIVHETLIGNPEDDSPLDVKSFYQNLEKQLDSKIRSIIAGFRVALDQANTTPAFSDESRRVLSTKVKALKTALKEDLDL